MDNINDSGNNGVVERCKVNLSKIKERIRSVLMDWEAEGKSESDVLYRAPHPLMKKGRMRKNEIKINSHT